MQFFLQLVLQCWKKNPLQVAEDILHVAITSCSFQSIQKKFHAIVPENGTILYFVQLLQT